MTHVIAVEARIQSDRHADLVAAVGRNARLSVESEPGCLQFDALLSLDDPLDLALYEVYTDASAFDAHQQTAHHQRYFHEAHDLLVSRKRTAYRRHSPSQSVKHTGAAMGSISLVITCLAQPGKVDALMRALDDVAEASRTQEPGCLQFDVLIDQADPAKILLYEVFRDQAAVEAHQQTAHFRKFLAEGVPLYASHALKRFERIAP